MRKNTQCALALLLLLQGGLAWCSSDGSGLGISVSGDLVGKFGDSSSSTSNDLVPRVGEITLSAPADHLFDGQLSFAAHYEGKIPIPELHELFLGSTKLIPRSRFRIGQFFLGLGRLNQFHQHDWPFISAPKVQQAFFASDEGAMDTGAEYSFLTPLPFFLELTLGLTRGYTFGHDHLGGAKPLVPTHYFRGVTYTSLPLGGGAQMGLNYLGRKDSKGISNSTFGLDLTAKWKEATQTLFLLQSEVWLGSLADQPRWGFYIYPQYFLGGSFFAGLRIDYYEESQASGFSGSVVSSELGVVPTVTYRSSEFVQFRLAYNLKPSFTGGAYASTDQFLEFQALFILGTHPAHDF